MAIPAATVFESRTASLDTNGGGFVTGGVGADYSQQDSAQASGTNLTVDAVTNTDVLPDGHTPDAADRDNVFNISAGAGFTPGAYHIVSIQAGKWRLDRSPAAVGTAGGTWALGGAFKTPGKAGSVAVAGNALWLKDDGTHLVTSASSNVAGGRVTWPAAADAVNHGLISGYLTTRGDSGRPTVQASGITGAKLFSPTTGNVIRNLILDGAALSSMGGVDGNNNYQVYNCKFRRFNNRSVSGSGCTVVFCEATEATGEHGILSKNVFYSVDHGNTSGGSIFTVGGITVGCYCIGSGSGFATNTNGTQYADCVAYGCPSSGFNFTLSSGAPVVGINLLAVNSGGYGFTGNALANNVLLLNCGGYNNTSGNVNNAIIPASQLIDFKTLTADPFLNAAGLDFSPLVSLMDSGLSAATDFLGLATKLRKTMGVAQFRSAGRLINGGLLGG